VADRVVGAKPPRKQQHLGGRYQPLGDTPLASDAVSVRLPVEVDAAVRAIPDRAEWLRRVITEAVVREGLIPQEAPESQGSDGDESA
jgi:hypothetical protein